MRRLVILVALGVTGCSPTVYERATAACRGENVASNERALIRDHYLPPNGHVRCGR